MEKKIYVRPVGRDYYADMFVCRLGEDMANKVIGIIESHWLNKEDFRFIITKASFEYNGANEYIGNDGAADALFEYITRKPTPIITNIGYFVDEFAQEVRCGKDALDLVRRIASGDENIPNSESEAMEYAKEHYFKGADCDMFVASNGYVLGVYRPISNLK
jgi:hypothetical protein